MLKKEDIMNEQNVIKKTRSLLDEVVLKCLDLGLSYIGMDENPDGISHDKIQSSENELFTKNVYFADFKGDKKEVFSLSYEVIDDRLKLTCEFPNKQTT